jgi:fucose permease
MVQVRAPFALVMPGLFLLGLGLGIWDVSQNLEGAVVERASGKPIMPWFHAAFSLGTVLGAVLGAGLTWLRAPIGAHVAVAAALSLAAVAWGTAGFTPAGGEHDHHSETGTLRPAANFARSAWIEPRTLLIGAMVLAAAFTEGTANDWMAVAFVDGHHVAQALGVIALAVFLSFMTIGRTLGTRLLDRYGRVLVLRTLFGAAIVGCALVVFGHLWLAFAGAALWGFGASLGFPVGMSAAADDPRRAALRLSVVSTIGYAAFLGGPPLLGFLGDHFGVLHALTAVGAISVLAAFVAPAARPTARSPQYQRFPAADGQALDPVRPCSP